MASEPTLQTLIKPHLDYDGTPLRVSYRVALLLQDLQHSETASIQEVTDLIHQDPALASRILQLVNSPAYRGKSTIDTINKAILRLGLKRIASFSMLAAQILAFRAKDARIKRHLQRLARHAYTCSSSAHWLTDQYLDRDLAEPAFLSALLQDIGELQILQTLDTLLLKSNPAPRFTEEHLIETLDAMHGEVGYSLMRAWGLPERYANIAREHHLPHRESCDCLCATVRLTNLAYRKAGFGLNPDPELEIAKSAEARYLGLDDAVCTQLLEVIIARKSAARTLF